MAFIMRTDETLATPVRAVSRGSAPFQKISDGLTKALVPTPGNSSIMSWRIVGRVHNSSTEASPWGMGMISQLLLIRADHVRPGRQQKLLGGIWKSSIAEYKYSSTTGFSLCISSINKTSLSSKFVNKPAKSPGLSNTGPEAVSYTHLTLPTICSV